MAPHESESLQKAMVVEFGGVKKYQRDYAVEAYPRSNQTYSLPDFRISADHRHSESRPLDETKNHVRKSNEIIEAPHGRSREPHAEPMGDPERIHDR